MEWYLAVLQKYVMFDGRARRKEFWMFTLFNVLVLIVLSVIDNVTGLAKAMGGIGPLYILYSLGTLLPNLAVSVRRLHDTGRSGWMVLIGLIPFVGAILLLIWFAADSDKSTNEYGPNPKGESAPDAVAYKVSGPPGGGFGNPHQ